MSATENFRPKKRVTDFFQTVNGMKRSNIHILVCNDDGIDAPGIFALVQEMKKIGTVTVVAPDNQQSAVGHAITMNHPLRVSKFSIGKKFFGYAINGTPADCVKIAVRTLLKKRPDILVSGINHGSNTSINIIYSGTVSAATEGTILGIPSIAFSLTTYERPDFRFAAKFARKLATVVLRNGLTPGTLLNVNVPAVSEKEISGIRDNTSGKNAVGRYVRCTEGSCKQKILLADRKIGNHRYCKRHRPNCRDEQLCFRHSHSIRSHRLHDASEITSMEITIITSLNAHSFCPQQKIYNNPGQNHKLNCFRGLQVPFFCTIPNVRHHPHRSSQRDK